MTSLAVIDVLQRLGLHAPAEFLLRRALRQARGPAREELQYRLALTLDALGRRHEAAACYAQAIDRVLMPWQSTRPPEPTRPRRRASDSPDTSGRW